MRLVTFAGSANLTKKNPGAPTIFTTSSRDQDLQFSVFNTS
jgi:hypothetical protein